MHTNGNLFKIHIWGTSHEKQMGVIVDAVPPGLSLGVDDFKDDLDRRRAGPPGTSKRTEQDVPHLISGLYKGKTTGAPVHIVFDNQNQNPDDYTSLSFPRPGHADFAANQKYKGYNDPRGGGFFSGRMTLLLVAAGVVAKKILQPLRFESQIIHIGGHADYENIVKQSAKDGDSIGGEVECRVDGLKPGIGEPFFYSLESAISQLVFSIPGAKAIAFGDGFHADTMKGSEFNDAIINAEGKTKTNHNGGINGGISNGNPMVFSVKFRSPASIAQAQNSWHPEKGKVETVSIGGRHDACYVLRTPVILEAVAAIAIADLYMIKKAIND
ncbi:MAG: chorismate synthase [Bacteroidales bacterium]